LSWNKRKRLRTSETGYVNPGTTMKTIRLYDIEWDVTYEEIKDSPVPSEEFVLPSEFTIQVNNHWDPVLEAGGLLYDTFRYCVSGYKWEEVKG
jgi:hypothetical protein